eukprot:9838157-Karenia_brevis.AAC.1
MAPPAAFVTRHICLNYPLCKSAQARKTANGHKERKIYCNKCSDEANPICRHPGCDAPVAPGARIWSTD